MLRNDSLSCIYYRSFDWFTCIAKWLWLFPVTYKFQKEYFGFYITACSALNKRAVEERWEKKQVYGQRDGGRMVGHTVVFCVLGLQIKWLGELVRFAANIVLLQRVDQQHSSMSDV